MDFKNANLVKKQNVKGVLDAIVVEFDGYSYTIPITSGNTDYEEYLEWVAEGNTPEPADE